MAGRRIAYLICLIGSAAFYIFYQEWFSWVLLLCVLGLPLLSLALSLAAMATVTVTPGCPATVTMGESARFFLKIHCRLPAPPVKGRLRLSRPFSGGPEKKRRRPGRPLPTAHCGGLICQPEKVYIYDYLGLFRHRLRRVPPGKTAVLPKPVPVEGVFLKSTAIHTRFRPKPGGGFAENHDLRPYRPGDNLRQIHWKMSAKTGKLIFREPIEPLKKQVVLSLTIFGSDELLDRKLGQLLWLGERLLRQDTAFRIQAFAGSGAECYSVHTGQELEQAMIRLLFLSPAAEEQPAEASAQTVLFHIEGEDAHEA